MTVVDLYTIQIIRDDEAAISPSTEASVDELMAEVEENLTDLLPPGYSARVRDWDDPADLDPDADEGNDDE